jgi:8-oxo-dGTP diphosphatase
VAKNPLDITMQLLKEIIRRPGMRTAGKTISRQAVRGIIRDGQNLLMIYSTQNGDYKFPGGGVETGETHQQALTREIREECGAEVREIGQGFGKIIEYDIPAEPDYDVFKMTSFYYCCQVRQTLGAQHLDQYEQELGFMPVWVEIDQALQRNREALDHINWPSELRWTVREVTILEQIKQAGF